MKKALLISLLVCVYIGVNAFPKGCYPLSLDKENITFKTKDQQLFYVHNKSELVVYLAFINRTGTAHAGWTTKIDGGSWSALALADSKLTFHCVEERPGSEQRVDCARVIEACRQAGLTFSKESLGNYWVANNNTYDVINEAVRRRGITPK